MRSYPVQAMKEVFEIARTATGHSPFPGKNISGKLVKDEYLYAEGVLSPSRRQNHQLYIGVLVPNKYEELLNNQNKPVHAILCRERDSLLWSQRQQVHKWFDRIYDPFLYVKTEDLPFDLDHIVPAHHMSRHKVKSRDESLFNDYRSGLLGSIGNLRIWPRSLNRSEQEPELDERYLLGPEEESLPSDDQHRFGEWDMSTYGEVRSASVFGQEEAERSVWERVCKSSDGVKYGHNWPKERLEAFRDAVDKRRTRLYADMYYTVGFNEWAAEG